MRRVIFQGDRPLSELVPMYRDPKSDLQVTQFNMKMVEAAGLVKFDFLGLKTLSVLDLAVKLAAQLGLSEGYRLIVNCKERAGQTVPHLHLHLLGGRDFKWPPG